MTAALCYSPEENKEPQAEKEKRVMDSRISNDPNCQPERYTESGIRDCSPVQK